MRQRPNISRLPHSGITLPELLVVVSIIGLAVMVAVPTISRAIHAARIRASVDHFAVTIRAVRMIAVTKQTPVTLTVGVDPNNYYEYVDLKGSLRRYDTPVGVRIVTSTSPILFQANGALASSATTRFEVGAPPSEVRTWEIQTNLMGISHILKDIGP